ncbi:MAG: DUF5808 domain-containing protein [Flaviflexus sp.]|nr:DUF5808 domain-containing protein [Flaviflexus sp.]
MFNPEDPRVLVPRLLGAGWTVNFGAVAVRLGVLRPDDTIADLSDHVPKTSETALRLLPWAGALAGIAGAAAGAAKSELPVDWDRRGEPRRFAPPWAAVGIPAAIGTLAGIWSASEPRSTGPDILRHALAAGISTGTATLIGCSLAGKPGRAGATLLTLVPAGVTALAVTGSLRAARAHLAAELRAEAERTGAGNGNKIDTATDTAKDERVS